MTTAQQKMLFPLISTIKLAAILQQQILPAIEATTQNAAIALPKEDNKTLIEWRNGCWRIVGDEGNDAMDYFQLECCAHSLHNQPNAKMHSNMTKCHFQIDFAKLLICMQRIEFLRLNECLGDEFNLIMERMKIAIGNNTPEFSISIGKWDGNSLLTSNLFNAIHAHFPPANVQSLELLLFTSILPQNANFSIQIANLGFFFPRLQQISIQSDRKMEGPKPKLFGRTFLRDLPTLKSLKIKNVDFEFDQREEPQWLGSLERIYLENASIGDLPRWMAKCKRLERIFLLNCALNSSISLSQLASAIQIKVNDNKIVDLHRVALKCGRLHELDLRNNSISRIAPHSFSQCHSLRFLDLSENPFGQDLPDKPFLGCQRLKRLCLEQIGLLHLRPEMFIGLSNLKSLVLFGNPISRIDPFTFLPTRSIRSISLANCSLHSIPLAVTQCCLLESLSLDDNLFTNRQSMPPELLALLGRLSHFSFQRNPLLQLPRGLFLYESKNEMEKQKLEQILNTLIHLPVWRLEPCTPFLWHFHLRNSSFPELRQKVENWNEERMEKERMGHCKQLYETILDGIAIYRELLENSGCEASRRLRSVRAKENCPAEAQIRNNEKNNEEMSHQNIGKGIVQLLLAPASTIMAPNSHTDPIPAQISSSSPNPKITNSNVDEVNFSTHFGLLHLSLGTNLLIFTFSIILVAIKMAKMLAERNGPKMMPKRKEFEEIY